MNTLDASAVFFAIAMAIAPSVALAEAPRTRFLVIAPDRGFLGNQEIREVFEEFKQSYALASLAWVGRDYNGVGTEYSAYLSRAIGELKQAGATEIVAIPLFLSKADPVLQKVVAHLPAYATAGTIR
jgi:hypothetical protein